MRCQILYGQGVTGGIKKRLHDMHTSQELREFRLRQKHGTGRATFKVWWCLMCNWGFAGTHEPRVGKVLDFMCNICGRTGRIRTEVLGRKVFPQRGGVLVGRVSGGGESGRQKKVGCFQCCPSSNIATLLTPTSVIHLYPFWILNAENCHQGPSNPNPFISPLFSLLTSDCPMFPALVTLAWAGVRGCLRGWDGQRWTGTCGVGGGRRKRELRLPRLWRRGTLGWLSWGREINKPSADRPPVRGGRGPWGNQG